MKTTLGFRFRHWCASFLFASVLATTSNASIIVINGTVTENFNNLPPANNWSTTAGPFGSNSANITNGATADALVGTVASPNGAGTGVTAALLNTQLTLVASSTVVTANQTRYYNDGTVGFIGTTPTGVDATLTMVTLTNGTGIGLNSFSVGYDLASQNAATQNDPEIAGHRVYFSLTGNENTWNPIGDFGTLGAVNFNVPTGGTWANGTNAFLLWLDDNGQPNPDGLYTIDNVRFTAVPEPSACLMAMGALGMFVVQRRRGLIRKLLKR